MLFDVLVIPEYTVNLLSVHKLIKDSKFSVGFDETKCYIQGLKKGRVLGTGSEFGGLYLFDKEYNKSTVANNSSLNLSNIDHEGPCEVCHKAKQTRDSFPLSENKSTVFGQLMHLDVWGPYKVISREWFRYFLTIVDEYSSPNDDEEGSSCRDGSVHQSGPSHSLDQPEVDERIPTSGSGSFISNLNKTLEPFSFEEAYKDPNWISAMNDEMNALYENDTWYLVDLPFGRKSIGSKWVFKIKYKSDGEVDRFKARVVANGFGQKEGLDFEETFSPVVKIGNVRCLLSLVVQNEWDIYQIDIDNAFLYGDLIEEVYMLPSPGFFDPSDKRVCTSKVKIAKFKHFFSNRFKIKDLGELIYFLGIEVLKVSGGLCLSQMKYCLELLHDFGLLACRHVLTPLPENIILSHKETEKDKFLVKITSYQRLVGKLIYLTLTRPDISYAVHCLSQHMHAPLKSHFDIALRLLKYLKLAPGFGVQFVKRQSGFNIKAFSDSNWAKCPVTRRNLLPAELYCDNKAAMQIAANPVIHEKTKHFDLDIHFIREKVCSGLIKTVKVESKDNVVDILTKALGSFLHDFLTKKF
nr:hypothetical protein [Tanacetum cinerariifolium]